ncbi:nuclear transport factor 2 family protein [Ruania alkalisoli]|uniref:Nuclear transport factor 2 family protein n=1 Tax=Ruania alkalisoli TaxID=2779775 RepID=A0A7M1SWD4_9MICO|nr:nuclear transport factor 2 family protein [Ruania alkalisoli]QOR71855.1 nuclear transport factor 2 family protein [Ruania alkalisoli]
MSSADLIRRHLNAFNSGDVDALMADLHPDATWVTGDHEVPPGTLREFFATAMAGLTPHLELHRIIDGAGVVAAELTETWTHDGQHRQAALVAIFDLRDGRIARAKIYREGSADA